MGAQVARGKRVKRRVAGKAGKGTARRKSRLWARVGANGGGEGEMARVALSKRVGAAWARGMDIKGNGGEIGGKLAWGMPAGNGHGGSPEGEGEWNGGGESTKESHINNMSDGSLFVFLSFPLLNARYNLRVSSPYEYCGCLIYLARWTKQANRYGY